MKITGGQAPYVKRQTTGELQSGNKVTTTTFTGGNFATASFQSNIIASPQFSQTGITHSTQGRLFRRNNEESIDDCWKKFQALHERREDSFKIDVDLDEISIENMDDLPKIINSEYKGKNRTILNIQNDNQNIMDSYQDNILSSPRLQLDQLRDLSDQLQSETYLNQKDQRLRQKSEEQEEISQDLQEVNIKRPEMDTLEVKMQQLQNQNLFHEREMLSKGITQKVNGFELQNSLAAENVFKIGSKNQKKTFEQQIALNTFNGNGDTIMHSLPQTKQTLTNHINNFNHNSTSSNNQSNQNLNTKSNSVVKKINTVKNKKKLEQIQGGKQLNNFMLWKKKLVHYKSFYTLFGRTKAFFNNQIIRKAIHDKSDSHSGQRISIFCLCILEQRWVRNLMNRSVFNPESMTCLLWKILLYYVVRVILFLKLVNSQRDSREMEKKLLMNFKHFYIIQLLNLVTNLFIIGHMIACLWYLMAVIQRNYLDASASWFNLGISQDGVWWKVYLNSFYWSFTLMVTGSNTANTPLEIFFTSIVMLFTTIVFGYTLNTIGVILSEMNQLKDDQRRDISVINKYMKRKQISRELQQRINLDLEQFYLRSAKNKSEEEQTVLKKISEDLSQEIKLEYNKNILSKVPLFSSNFSEGTLNKLCLLVEEVFFSPNQLIPLEKEPSLLVIVSGESNKMLIQLLCLHYLLLVSIYKSDYEYDIIKKDIQDSKIYSQCEDQTSKFSIDFQKKDVSIIKGVTLQQKKRGVLIEIIKEGMTFGEWGFLTGNQRGIEAESRSFTTALKIDRKMFLEATQGNKSDWERFYEMRDKLEILRDLSIIKKECELCNDKSHQIIECSSCHIKKENNFLMARSCYSPNQMRNNAPWLRIGKGINSLLNLKKVKETACKFKSEVQLDESEAMFFDDLKLEEDDIHQEDDEIEEEEDDVEEEDEENYDHFFDLTHKKKMKDKKSKSEFSNNFTNSHIKNGSDPFKHSDLSNIFKQDTYGNRCETSQNAKSDTQGFRQENIENYINRQANLLLQNFEDDLEYSSSSPAMQSAHAGYNSPQHIQDFRQQLMPFSEEAKFKQMNDLRLSQDTFPQIVESSYQNAEPSASGYLQRPQRKHSLGRSLSWLSMQSNPLLSNMLNPSSLNRDSKEREERDGGGDSNNIEESVYRREVMHSSQRESERMKKTSISTPPQQRLRIFVPKKSLKGMQESNTYKSPTALILSQGRAIQKEIIQFKKLEKTQFEKNHTTRFSEVVPEHVIPLEVKSKQSLLWMFDSIKNYERYFKEGNYELAIQRFSIDQKNYQRRQANRDSYLQKKKKSCQEKSNRPPSLSVQNQTEMV